MKACGGKVALVLLGIITATLVALANHQQGSTAYRRVNLVSDIAGVAEFTDPNLVNPWGIALNPRGIFWISDNGAGVSTLYLPDGTAQSLIVTIPPPAGSTNPATPTGVEFNSSSAFVVASGTNSGPSVFIFATEDGTVAGWNPSVDLHNAVLAIDHSASGAVYKGIALAQDNASNQFLFVANFHDGVVEKFDANFNPISSFTDSNLPAGYAPFGIRTIGGNLYVTFALQNGEKHDDVAGPGNGFVDVFDINGNLVRQFAAHGTLNSPWGLALAPGNFGKFSHALLVGNFGDGLINAFDPSSGSFLGQLTDRRGNLIAIDGLWGLFFFQPQSVSQHHPSKHGRGKGDNEQGDDNQGDEVAQISPRLYFTAGLAHEEHGLFGFIKPIQIELQNDD